MGHSGTLAVGSLGLLKLPTGGRCLPSVSSQQYCQRKACRRIVHALLHLCATRTCCSYAAASLAWVCIVLRAVVSAPLTLLFGSKQEKPCSAAGTAFRASSARAWACMQARPKKRLEPQMKVVSVEVKTHQRSGQTCDKLVHTGGKQWLSVGARRWATICLIIMGGPGLAIACRCPLEVTVIQDSQRAARGSGRKLCAVPSVQAC